MSKRVYRIQSRTSDKFRWRYVTKRPHGEPHEFDPVDGRLRFKSFESAKQACDGMASANGGDFRVVVDHAVPVTQLQQCTSEDPAVAAYDILTKLPWGEIGTAYHRFSTEIINRKQQVDTAARLGLGKHLMAQDLLTYVRESLQEVRDVADKLLQQMESGHGE